MKEGDSKENGNKGDTSQLEEKEGKDMFNSKVNGKRGNAVQLVIEENKTKDNAKQKRM